MVACVRAKFDAVELERRAVSLQTSGGVLAFVRSMAWCFSITKQVIVFDDSRLDGTFDFREYEEKLSRWDAIRRSA